MLTYFDRYFVGINDAANASGSAFARIAKNASDIAAQNTAIGTNADAINAINDADNGILA